MRSRWFGTLTAIGIVFILSGGTFLMLRHQKHQRVKQRYDTYMAQLDTMMLPEITSGETEYDKISDKAEAAKNYLMKHAPHLLTPDEIPDGTDDPYKDFIADLRKNDPKAAAKLDAQLAQNQREYEANIAGLNAELATFEQELRDHEADMVAFEKRRETSQQDRIEFERKAAEDRARLDKLIDKLRSHLILDENGKLIGIKESSIFNNLRSHNGSPSETDIGVLPVDVHKEPGVSENSVVEAPEISPAMTADPNFWQQTLTREMAGLDAVFYEKYPDVVITTLLSDSEYQQLFPTQRERSELHKRTKSLQNAYATQIDVILQSMPIGKRNTLIKHVQDELTRQWDKAFSDTIMRQLKKETN